MKRLLILLQVLAVFPRAAKSDEMEHIMEMKPLLTPQPKADYELYEVFRPGDYVEEEHFNLSGSTDRPGTTIGTTTVPPTVTTDRPSPPEPWLSGNNVCRITYRRTLTYKLINKASGSCSVQSRQHTYCFHEELFQPEEFDDSRVAVEEYVYRCCWGYRYKGYPYNDCIKHRNLLTTSATMERLNATVMLNEINKAGMTDIYNDYAYLTIFAPRYAARLGQEVENDTSFDTDTEFLPEHRLEAILYHTLRYPYDLEYGFTVLPTAMYETNYIRISVWPPMTKNNDWDGVACANGVTILKPNVYTKNAVIHMIEHPLPFPKESVETILKNDPELSSFYRELETGLNLTVALRLSERVTIIAPTNRVMAFLSKQADGHRMFSDECLEQNMNSFILTGTWCPATLGYAQTVPSLGGNSENLTDHNWRNLTHKEGVDGVVLRANYMEIPSKVKDLDEVLKKYHVTFHDFLKETGQDQELYALNESSVFLPPDEGFIENIGSKGEANEIRLMYSDIFVKSLDNDTGMTISHVGDRNVSLHVHMYKYPLARKPDLLTVNCAPVKYITRACRSKIYHMGESIRYPKWVLYHFFEMTKNVSRFHKEAMKIDPPERYILDEGGFTMFVIDDAGFSEFVNFEQRYTVLDFVLKGHHCCQSADDDAEVVRRAVSGKRIYWKLNVKDSKNYTIYVPPKTLKFKIIECNIMISPNIVIHKITVDLPELPANEGGGSTVETRLK